MPLFNIVPRVQKISTTLHQRVDAAEQNISLMFFARNHGMHRRIQLINCKELRYPENCFDCSHQVLKFIGAMSFENGRCRLHCKRRTLTFVFSCRSRRGEGGGGCAMSCCSNTQKVSKVCRFNLITEFKLFKRRSQYDVLLSFDPLGMQCSTIISL